MDGYGESLLRVDDAAKPRVTAALVLTTFLGSMGSAQFGWGIGVLNAPTDVIKSDLGLEDWQANLLQAALSIAALFGAQLSGGVLDRAGRRAFLLYTAALFLVGGALPIAANFVKATSQPGAYGALFAGRVLVGFGVGAASAGCPLYLGEIAPPALKGAYGSVAQFQLTIFLLLSEVAGIVMSTSDLWGYLIGAHAVFGVLSLLTAPWLLESPRWLVARGRLDEAAKTLMALRGYSVGAAEAEVAEIRRSADAGGAGAGAAGKDGAPAPPPPPPSAWTVLRDPVFRKPVLIACVLQVAQQLSGINAVFFFSSKFFKNAGIANPNVGTVLAGAVNVVATGLGLWVIDRAGRKPLLLVGAAGMGLAAVGLTGALVAKTDANAGVLGPLIIALVLIYVTFFEVGLGSIPWIIGGEMLPEGPRATGMAIAAGVNWLFTTVIALGFPPVADALGNYAFMPFVASLVCTFLFSLWAVPETKGRTPDQVIAWLQGGAARARGALLGADDDEDEEGDVGRAAY